MAPKARKRRSPGEGSVWPYRTKAGQLRYAIGYVRLMPDGTRKAVTRRTGPNGERWTTERDAKRALRAVLVAADKGELVNPSKQQVGAYLDEWLAGLRLAPSTVASYRKNVRLHLAPHIGAVPLASLTTARIDALYRQLERGGRADHKAGEGLSPRTVRYVHTILSAALGAAVKHHRLARNPAATASPPSARQARAPEMHPWTAAQLAAFLGWSAGQQPASRRVAAARVYRHAPRRGPRAALARRQPRRGHGQCPPVGRRGPGRRARARRSSRGRHQERQAARGRPRRRRRWPCCGRTASERGVDGAPARPRRRARVRRPAKGGTCTRSGSPAPSTPSSPAAARPSAPARCR